MGLIALVGLLRLLSIFGDFLLFSKCIEIFKNIDHILELHLGLLVLTRTALGLQFGLRLLSVHVG